MSLKPDENMPVKLPAKLVKAAKRLIARSGETGQICKPAQFAELNNSFSNAIPEWYARLMCEFPLANLSLGWKNLEPAEDFDGITWIVLSDAPMIQALLESYPAMYLHDRGYFPIGNNATGAGNVFLLSTEGSSTDPLYELWHDVSHDSDELIRALTNGDRGTETVADSFTDFLVSCDVE